MKRFLLLLVLSACSSGPPTIYGQGIPVAPSAPAFNPTWDAPITTGQPGYIGSPERAPRGTDKRVLPPTKEAGIWASSKEPKMPDPRPNWPVKPAILGVPLPEPGEKGDNALFFSRKCAHYVFNAVERVARTEDLPSLSQGMTRCLAARLYVACLDIEGKAVAAHGNYDQFYYQYLAKARRAATDFEKHMCLEKVLPFDAQHLLESVQFQLQQFNKQVEHD